jgi:hypothetical protein
MTKLDAMGGATGRSEDEAPKIFRVAELGKQRATRRAFLEGTLKAAGGAALLSHVTACEEVMDVTTDESGACTCHVVGADEACTCQSVCTCNAVSTCVCNTVCTCNTVGGRVDTRVSDCPTNCSCNGHCSCNRQGGGHYWYPC